MTLDAWLDSTASVKYMNGCTSRFAHIAQAIAAVLVISKLFDEGSPFLLEVFDTDTEAGFEIFVLCIA